MIIAIRDSFFRELFVSVWDTKAKNYEKKTNIQLIFHRQGFRNFVDTFPLPLNNDQIIVTFNSVQAHSFLLKKISWTTENCLMETECWVSIAWGCLAIMLHEIRHSLFQLLKIRSHEKWQREKKGQNFLILWYLNYEIRNCRMWRNNLNLHWNFEGHMISLWSCNDSGNFNDPKRIFLTLLV